MRRMLSTAMSEFNQSYIIYIDGPYVLAVSLEVGKLHVQAPVHDLRAH